MYRKLFDGEAERVVRLGRKNSVDVVDDGSFKLMTETDCFRPRVA